MRAAAREQDRQPHGPGGLLRREALLEIPPGDLRSERVEPGPPAVAKLGEGAGELVPAAVRPADGSDQRITGPLLRHPVQARDKIDELDHVAALVVRVHHVRDAGALAEAALVEAQYAEAGVEPRFERRRVRGPAAAPPMAVEDQRHGVLGRGGRRFEQRVADPYGRRRTRLWDRLRRIRSSLCPRQRLGYRRQEQCHDTEQSKHTTHQSLQVIDGSRFAHARGQVPG